MDETLKCDKRDRPTDGWTDRREGGNSGLDDMGVPKIFFLLRFHECRYLFHFTLQILHSCVSFLNIASEKMAIL